MDLKNLDLTKKIRLVIDKQEMIFGNEISIEDHPSNFSSITFLNVLPKQNSTYPQYLAYQHFAEIFSIGEVYCGDKLIFFGIVNSTGRLSFNKHSVKSKAIKIVDFRKWLSIKRPIDLIFLKKSPSYVVNELIGGLNEPRIVVGNLDFGNNQLIDAYSITNKSPYSVLKEVIGHQSNSFLYFTINDKNQMEVNFKAVEKLSKDETQTVEPDLDLSNLDLLKDYKLNNVDLEFDNDRYVNNIIISSQNIVSSTSQIDYIQIYKSDNVATTKTIGYYNQKNESTFLAYKNAQDPLEFTIVKQRLEVTSIEDNETINWDLKYKINDSSLIINQKLLDNLDPKKEYFISFEYQPLLNLSTEHRNQEEINRVGSLSNTKGEVFRSDKFDDITNYKDLARIAISEISKNSKITRTITIESDKPIWNVADIVYVNYDDHITDNYLVHEITAKLKINYLSNTNTNQLTGSFVTTLKSTANTDVWINLFDNQNYRSDPAYNRDAIIHVIKSDEDIDDIVFKSNLAIEKPKFNWRFNNGFKVRLSSVEYENQKRRLIKIK